MPYLRQASWIIHDSVVINVVSWFSDKGGLLTIILDIRDIGMLKSRIV